MIDFSKKDRPQLPTCPKCGAGAALVIRGRRYHCVRCGRDLGAAYVYVPRRVPMWAW